ncbi:MAG: AraC family transcriptional regulator [Alphaproteobacteria bacterium]|nr:AraC family transcriptional regulator [Alphaproteobacteria bacterium]
MADAGTDRLTIDYVQPDPRLTPYVSGYHRYALRLDPGERHGDVFFPGWINLRFSLEAEPWQVRLGRRAFPVPEAALFGPSRHAGYVDAGRGTLLGAGLTPLGWARLFGGDVSLHADRIAPLDRLLGPDTETLAARLGAGEPFADVLDSYFLARLAATPTEPPEVAALFSALGGVAADSVIDLGRLIGTSPRTLNRVSRTAFGFTPKVLLRRARFMRALLAALAVERGGWAEAIAAAGYYDHSHFLRDCRLFLDMPLGEFAALPKPLAERSLRLRAAALGAPAQALHRDA